MRSKTAQAERRLLGLPRWVHLLVPVMLVAALFGTGYRYNFGGNHAVQLPLVLQRLQPELYHGDAMADVLPTYASAFWWVIAWAASWVALEPLLFGLFLLERVLLLYGVAVLSRTMLPDSRLAVVGGMSLVVLGMSPLLAAGTVVADYLEQTGFALAWYTLAVAACLRQRPLWCGLLFGLGFGCNSLYGIYTAAYLVAAFLAWPALRVRWWRWLGSAAVAGILAAPVLLQSLAVMAADGIDLDSWVWAVRQRTVHHVMPTGWGWTEVATYCAFAGGLVAIVLAARRDRECGPTRAVLLGWTLVAVGAMAVAWYADLAGHAALLQMMPGRVSDPWYLWGSVAALVLVERRLRIAKAVEGIGLVLAGLVLVAFWRPPGGVVLVVAGVLAGFIALRWAGGRDWRVRTTAIGVGCLSVLTAADAYLVRVGQADAWWPALVRTPSEATEALGRWARANTAVEATFLTSTDDVCFRTVARRGVFLTWKDGTAMMWSKAYTKLWVERLEDIGYPAATAAPDGSQREVLRGLYDSLSVSDILRLARRYGLDYWVASPGRSSPFPVVFENEMYRVFELPRTAVAGARVEAEARPAQAPLPDSHIPSMKP